MKKAFTLLEIIFVVLVIGIISVVLVPKFNSIIVSEKVIKLIAKIRYTQHLAIIDNKYDTSDENWK